MAKINAINNKSGDLTVDPGASGDSFLQYSINGIGEFRIGVDDTDDSFRISQGSALGTNDTFIALSTGQRTMPLHPAFSVLNTVTDADVTGDGTAWTMNFNNVFFDQSGDFASDTFTAPVTGCYAFNCNFLLKEIAGTHTSCTFALVTSNRTYTINVGDPGNYVGGANFTANGSFFADMEAADTAHMSLTVSGGAKVVDFFGSVGLLSVWSSFSGYLVC